MPKELSLDSRFEDVFANKEQSPQIYARFKRKTNMEGLVLASDLKTEFDLSDEALVKVLLNPVLTVYVSEEDFSEALAMVQVENNASEVISNS